ncbi:MAG: hypothetical protein IJ252_08475 [Solobacterium sp.]|nr:hypothetical protein [Solobacterium sp.]
MFTNRPAKLPETAGYSAAMTDVRLTGRKLQPDLPDVPVILLCSCDQSCCKDPAAMADISCMIIDMPECD